MQKARSMRFGKWPRKVIVSYAVFIAIGLLLSLVSASRLGCLKKWKKDYLYQSMRNKKPLYEQHYASYI